MATTGNEEVTDKDWMFDYLLSLLRSPQWDISIMGFIDENCAVFDTDDENKLSYTSLHRQFKDLVSLADESIVSAKMTGISKAYTAQPIVCCLSLYTRQKQARFLFDVLHQSIYIFLIIATSRSRLCAPAASQMLELASKTSLTP